MLPLINIKAMVMLVYTVRKSSEIKKKKKKKTLDGKVSTLAACSWRYKMENSDQFGSQLSAVNRRDGSLPRFH